MKKIRIILIILLALTAVFKSNVEAASLKSEACPTLQELTAALTAAQSQLNFLSQGAGVLTIKGFPWSFTGNTDSFGNKINSFWTIFQENQHAPQCKILPRSTNSPCTYIIDSTQMCTSTANDVATITITYEG